MDTLRAFAMGAANKGKEPMVFDWNKAAEMIAERNCSDAAAGLSGDWEFTGGKILTSGEPVQQRDTYTYLASTWATPELEIDGVKVPCFLMESETPGWDSGTYWPESARDILSARKSAQRENTA